MSLNLLNPSAQFVICPRLGSALTCSKSCVQGHSSVGQWFVCIYTPIIHAHTRKVRVERVLLNYTIPLGVHSLNTSPLFKALHYICLSGKQFFTQWQPDWPLHNIFFVNLDDTTVTQQTIFSTRKGTTCQLYVWHPCSIRRTPTRNITFRSLRKGPCGTLHHVFLCIRPLVKTHYWFFFPIEVLSYHHNLLHKGSSWKALVIFFPCRREPVRRQCSVDLKVSHKHANLVGVYKLQLLGKQWTFNAVSPHIFNSKAPTLLFIKVLYLWIRIEFSLWDSSKPPLLVSQVGGRGVSDMQSEKQRL